MLNGEFESSKMIYELMPDFIPKPTGFGKYKQQDPATYFYLSDFVNMDVTTAPEPAEFTSRLAKLHKTSQSPTGKFGFPVTTYDGKTAHTVDWEESWAVFYRKLLVGVCKLDLETNGPWPELECATKQIAEKVIPRLLGALQAEGHPIKPCIIHGDLWEGNMGINMQTGDSLLFDAGSYFAHNEMELGIGDVSLVRISDRKVTRIITCKTILQPSQLRSLMIVTGYIVSKVLLITLLGTLEVF